MKRVEEVMQRAWQPINSVASHAYMPHRTRSLKLALWPMTQPAKLEATRPEMSPTARTDRVFSSRASGPSLSLTITTAAQKHTTTAMSRLAICLAILLRSTLNQQSPHLNPKPLGGGRHLRWGINAINNYFVIALTSHLSNTYL